MTSVLHAVGSEVEARPVPSPPRPPHDWSAVVLPSRLVFLGLLACELAFWGARPAALSTLVVLLGGVVIGPSLVKRNGNGGGK